MKKITAAVLCSALTLSVFAQSTQYGQKKLNLKPREVEWADKPVLHDVPPEYNGEPAYFVLHDVNLDYKYEGRTTNMYVTLHEIVKVLDEKGIEMFATTGFSVGSYTRVPKILARTIRPDGKVQDIPQDMIKVTRDEMGQYKIVIAMEGVEKNSDVELLVKEIKPGYDFGTYPFQFLIPIQSAHFRLTSPKDIVFEERGYNGFPTVKDTLLNNRHRIEITKSNIPALMPEPYSFYEANIMRLEYRIDHVTYYNHNDFSRLDTWDNLARKIFNNHYKITEKERGAVNKFLTELGVHAGSDEEENIKKIEDGIKKNITLYAFVEEKNGDMLDSVVATHHATATGYIKLFAACFTQALVSHELGLAADRTEERIQSKFENWNSADYYVFYFPKQKKYLAPLDLYYRYPLIPADYAYGKAVFCIIPPKSEASGMLAKTRTILTLSPKQNQKNVAASVSFADDMNADIDISYAYKGYPSVDIRKRLLLQTKDKEKKFVEGIVSIAEKPSALKTYSISGADLESFYSGTPLEITAKVNTDNLTQKAGGQYLFRIGQILAPQQDLYSEKKRVMPIDLLYPMTTHNTITVNIPKGYKILNPEVLRNTAEYVDRDLNPKASYHSDYQLIPDKKNGDKLVVTVTENYPVIHFPVSDYQRFKEVANAVADFTKVVLVLEKKGSSGPAKIKGKPVATK